jgi:hypothetical protein
MIAYAPWMHEEPPPAPQERAYIEVEVPAAPPLPRETENEERGVIIIQIVGDE